MTTRWLFGDQLGPHFCDDHDGRFLLVESRRVFARRRFHRAKAHLVLSAMRHRAAELGDRVSYRQTARYGDGVRSADRKGYQVVQPTSFAAVDLVTRLGVE
jgi:deoxyribodipyrimidine photolyase-related protein